MSAQVRGMLEGPGTGAWIPTAPWGGHEVSKRTWKGMESSASSRSEEIKNVRNAPSMNLEMLPMLPKVLEIHRKRKPGPKKKSLDIYDNN